MELYIVTADTYQDDIYGSTIELLLISDNPDDADKCARDATKNGWEVCIDAVTLNQSVRIPIGGYIE